MKSIFLLFLMLCSFVNAQNNMLGSMPLSINKSYSSFNELTTDSENHLIAKIGNIHFYHRSDSTFLSYYHYGAYQEFVFSDTQAFLAKDLSAIELIDLPGNIDLFVVKMNIEEHHGTALTNPIIENRLNCRIVNLENHSLVLNLDIEKRYTEIEYIYAEDITNPALSEAEKENLFRNREKEVYSCMYLSDFHIHNSIFTIKTLYSEGGQGDCAPDLEDGQYELVNGSFEKQ